MRKIYIAFLITLVCAANSVIAQTFTGANFTVPTTGTSGTASGTVAVAGVGVVANGANIKVRVQLNHTFVSDLHMWLVGPGGQTLELQTGVGNGNNNMDVTYSDGAATFITAATAATSTTVGGCPPASYIFNGTFKPEGRNNVIPVFPTTASNAPAVGTFTFANTFSGLNANGNWTLHINDHVGGDVGATCIWSIIFPLACAENFDGVTAPTLPPMWTSTSTGVGVPWVTSTVNPVSVPNNAFAPNATNIGTCVLQSRIFPIISPTAQLSFQNLYNLENNFDGMVLEISINGGAYADIITAGGSFVVGGYDDVISTAFGSPIGGRLAWNGLSGGSTAAPTYKTTTVNLPAAANGQNIQLRWIVATDNSLAAGGAAGARIDNITLTGSDCGGDCTGTPVPGTISGATTACVGGNVNLTVAGYTNLPGIALQWRSSTTPGGPYTNIVGATNANYTAPAVAGVRYYVVRVTCTAGGLFAETPEYTVAVGATIHTTVSSTITTACSPGEATITGTASGGLTTGFSSVYGTSGTINLNIPDNTPAGVSSVINVPFGNMPAAADLKVRINARHSFVGDLKFALTSPCGTTFLFDRPGVPVGAVGNSDNLGTSNATTPPPAVYTFDIGAATVIPENFSAPGFIPSGSYRPSDVDGAPQNWAGLTFPCAATGNWTLTVSDNAGIDVGQLVDWQILGPGIYTHTLTGPGTIVQNTPTGTANATGNFTVTNIPFGPQTYTLTSTDAIGCSVVSQVNLVIKQTPTISFTQNPVNPICNGNVQTITANVVPPLLTTFETFVTTVIPAGAPANSSGTGDPYPSTINVSGLPNAGATVKSVKLGNFNHTFPDDVDIILVSPTGVAVVLASDAGGGTDVIAADWVISDAAASTMSDGGVNADGTYKPTNFESTDTWVAPGPGTVTQATPLLANFGNGNHNGTWRLYVVDDATGDVGTLGNWNIVFNVPPTVVFTPTTGLYTNPAATIPYTGTPVTVVYAKPTTTTVYTANTTVDGCSSSNTVTVVVNQLPVITVEPTPTTQTVCPNYHVTYTATTTGTSITHRWQRSPDGVAPYVDLVDNVQISGATTNSLTISYVTAANAGRYRLIVTGVCPPADTSNVLTLNIGSAPVISTQPANRAVCVGQSAAFTVATVGSVPPPTIFQWQSSPNGLDPWTNLTTGGSYTSTFTLSNAQLTDNNYRFRVIVTNSCGQTTTSSAATLTVNANPVVTAAVLPKICISDTLVALVGTPIGGSWSGIGVSGFNFVPAATAVGTYTLTYSYTNAAGCTGTATTIAKVEDCQERLRLLQDDAVILFPNPNNGRFNFKMNSTLYKHLGMRVYTTNGELVATRTWGGLVYGRVVPVDLTYLPGAAYLVKFFYEDGVRTSEKTFTVIIARD